MGRALQRVTELEHGSGAKAIVLTRHFAPAARRPARQTVLSALHLRYRWALLIVVPFRPPSPDSSPHLSVILSSIASVVREERRLFSTVPICAHRRSLGANLRPKFHAESWRSRAAQRRAERIASPSNPSRAPAVANFFAAVIGAIEISPLWIPPAHRAPG